MSWSEQSSATTLGVGASAVAVPGCSKENAGVQPYPTVLDPRQAGVEGDHSRVVC